MDSPDPTNPDAIDAVVSALRSQAAVRPVVAADLMNAPIPASCRHAAGRLKNGILPGLTNMTGFAGVVDRAGGGFLLPPVVTDLTGDGIAELAGVLHCTAGGVGWPNLIVVYGSGPKLLGSYDLAAVANAEHAEVQSMTAENGNLRLDWDTYEGAGDNTKSFTGLPHWGGTTFVLRGPHKPAERVA